MICGPDPVVVTVMQIPMAANWEHMESRLILRKTRLPNYSFWVSLTLPEVDLSSEWL